jgi:hypothetical protein
MAAWHKAKLPHSNEDKNTMPKSFFKKIAKVELFIHMISKQLWRPLHHMATLLLRAPLVPEPEKPCAWPGNPVVEWHRARIWTVSCPRVKDTESSPGEAGSQ